MPSLNFTKDVIKPEFMEKIQSNIKKIKLEKVEWTKKELAITLQKEFWIQANFDDIRISESPKLI